MDEAMITTSSNHNSSIHSKTAPIESSGVQDANHSARRVDIDNTVDDPAHRAPLVLGDATLASVTQQVCGIAERRPPRAWYVAFAIASSLALMLVGCIGYLFTTGVGVWGNNQPVAWAFDITNFVFWVGIGHAGTLISAVLFLFRQNWRTSINRFAEAMTIFAVICAGMFPAIHIGRPWLAYWLMPYPNQMGTVPQFRSPLLWDAFAVGTYATVSLLFWYVGMIPDLASLRDRATTRGRFYFYGILSLGWRGSQRHWHRFERMYLLLAALATPLVLSVHSVVSFDFATSQLPGWHTTILPPYFVAGAIFSGFAMVVTLAVVARRVYGLENLITRRHLDNMAKVILATGMMMTFSYSIELFGGLNSTNATERFVALNRIMGSQAISWWTMIICNVVAPQLLWSRRLRQHQGVLFVVAILINIGMWFERFVICTTLGRDYLPSSWHGYTPTLIDMMILIGSFGLFFTLFLLFLRFLPIVAMAEVKGVLAHEQHERHHAHHADHARHPHAHASSGNGNGNGNHNGNGDDTPDDLMDAIGATAGAR